MRYLRWSLAMLLTLSVAGPIISQVRTSDKDFKIEFRTSDRCVACHNGLKTKAGEDISIGFEWRASVMANSSRDPYWQGSVRRESIDHPESQAAIENECSTCHMPLTHYTARSEGRQAQVFSHLPLSSPPSKDGAAADGVSCSICHQMEKTRLETPESFNGNVVFASVANAHERPEYGPFVVDKGHQRVMQSSTNGMVPENSEHIRDSALCGSCHTLYTKTLGAQGEEIGTFPEQMPYLEWLHSDYPKRQTCQSCHMPEVKEPVAVTAVYGPLRQGMHRHEFIGGNFVLQQMLNDYRSDLHTAALPQELVAASGRTIDFLKSQSARVTLQDAGQRSGKLSLEVRVENLTGHKMPTAYPSRRAWLHVVIEDRDGRTIFESGALRADGSIVGNANDDDPQRYEHHHREITTPQQVEIFEPILGDRQGHVTTGLLSAVRYLKDNRLLPSGFDKHSATHDIAVVGDALDDPQFTDKGSVTRYVVDTTSAPGPFHVRAELWYQPVGFRWAHNLAPYKAAEPQRFVQYYESEARRSAVVLASADGNY
ncbi:MAG TPA: hypothetical protein VFE01_11450 [Terracidiphilus sp.]|nr:hypothetical protein [Terracidiphilus sp.]